VNTSLSKYERCSIIVLTAEIAFLQAKNLLIFSWKEKTPSESHNVAFERKQDTQFLIKIFFGCVDLQPLS
jgi:hypothetical protein